MNQSSENAWQDDLDTFGLLKGDRQGKPRAEADQRAGNLEMASQEPTGFTAPSCDLV